MKHIHIEKKDRGILEESVQTLRERLHGHQKKPLTAADAATLSGLPLDITEASLLALFSQHPATLSVTENGTLRFVFDSLSQKRAEPTLWQTFQKKYLPPLIRAKYFIEDKIIFFVMPLLMLILCGNILGLLMPLALDFPGATLLRYFPGSLVLLVIALLGSVAVMMQLFLLFLFGGVVFVLLGTGMILSSFYLLFTTPKVGMVVGILLGGVLSLSLGLSYAKFAAKTIHELSSRDDSNAVISKLWQAFRSYLFGTRSKASTQVQDALFEERRLTALIQQKQGTLCLRDLVQLFGWTPDQAEAELSRILLDYGGDIQVTDNGQLRYHFAAWQEKTTIVGNEDLRPIWQRSPAAPLFWSGGTTNAKVLSFLLLLGILGLVVAALVYQRVEFLFPTEIMFWRADTSVNWLSVFGIWPYMGIAAILSLRAVPWYVRTQKHQRMMTQHNLLKSICEQAETGGWHKDSDFLQKFRAEIDESKGTKDGMYFFTFPALQ